MIVLVLFIVLFCIFLNRKIFDLIWTLACSNHWLAVTAVGICLLLFSWCVAHFLQNADALCNDVEPKVLGQEDGTFYRGVVLSRLLSARRSTRCAALTCVQPAGDDILFSVMAAICGCILQVKASFVGLPVQLTDAMSADCPPSQFTGLEVLCANIQWTAFELWHFLSQFVGLVCILCQHPVNYT